MEWIIPAIVAGILVVVIYSCVKIVPQGQAWVVEFLGKYMTTWDAGIHIMVPFFERVANRVSLKEDVRDAPPQPVITKDNVTMQIDTVVFYRVFDPKLYTYGAVDPKKSLDNLTATTLRNVVGELELDETLTSRDKINGKMAAILDEATDPWGIKVIRVELKNIDPPKSIEEAMEMQMKAEREKRARILDADAHREADIKLAEGHKQALVLEAEGERDARIARAEGEAKALFLSKQAEADSLRLLKSVGVDEAVLRLRQYEAMTKIADGKAAKIIIPTDMVNMATKNVVFSETTGIGDTTQASDEAAPAVQTWTEPAVGSESTADSVIRFDSK